MSKLTHNIEHLCCRKLIEHFCYQPNWAKEIKIAKKLLKICPDINAWLEIKNMCPMYSLSFFLTESGKILIPDSKENPYLLDISKF